MKPIKRKQILFIIFPKLKLVEFSVDSLKWVYTSFKSKDNKSSKKMKLPIKIGIGSVIALVVIIIFGFIAFPKMIKGKIRKVSMNCYQ